MNLTWVKLKGVVQSLNRIASACERLAECWEAELAERGHYMSPPKADVSGPEPELTYVDEEADALAELEAKLRGRKAAEEELEG